MNSTDSANAVRRDAGGSEEEHECRLAGAETVDGDRQQHHQQDDRDEGEVGGEGGVSPRASPRHQAWSTRRICTPTEASVDGAEQGVMRGVALDGVQDGRARGVDAGPRQALHEGDERRDRRAEDRRGHGGTAGRGDRQGGEHRRPVR